MSNYSNGLFREGNNLSLRGGFEWKVITIDTADISRLVNDQNDTVISSHSVSGDISSVTINGDVRSRMGSGPTNPQNCAAGWWWKVLKPDGTAYKLNENVMIDLYLEWTGGDTGSMANNSSQLALGVSDGETFWANGKYASYVRFPNNAYPRTGIWTQGGGTTIDTANSSNTLIISKVWTTPAGTVWPPFRYLVTESFDSNLDPTYTRLNSGLSGYCNGQNYPNRTTDMYVFFAAGRSAFGGSYTSKSFSVRLAYRVWTANYQGVTSWSPGS
jgi:hypothetical protein